MSTSVRSHDGHTESWLNCVALRHGWTRTFSISPDEVHALDYASLERILELATLKLRSSNLRIFVENPVGSGEYSKVRFWKDDTSLQSVLVKEFFAQRLRDGVIVRFEVRDGRERRGGGSDRDDAAESVGSEATGPALRQGKKKRSMTMDWFSKKGAHKDAGENQNPSRARRFLNAVFGKRHTVAASADEITPLEPHSIHEDEFAEGHEDEEHKRLKYRKSLRMRLANENSPFFASPGTRTSVRTRPERVKFQTGSPTSPLARTSPSPGNTPVATPDSERDIHAFFDQQEEIEKVKRLNKFFSLLRPLFGRAPSSTANSPPRKLKRHTAPKPARKDKTMIRDDPSRFRGADVVRRPEDAFPPRVGSTGSGSAGSIQPCAEGSSSANERAADVLDAADDDPFRG